MLALGGSKVLSSLPGLFLVALIVLVARFVTETTNAFFERVREGRLVMGWLDGETARPTGRLVAALIWLFALVMAYPYLPGSQTEAFKGLSVLVGLMVTIGSSSVFAQLASGLILVFSRAVRTGDYVRIGPDEGTVVELGTFATRLRTGLGEDLMLPNTVVMAATTRNYSRGVVGKGCTIETTVTIGYSTPWRQVQAMLEEAARRTPGIAAEPAPFVRQTGLSDFYVEYRLVAYTPEESPDARPAVRDRLHSNIQDAFNENGVQIMSPHYMIDPDRPHVVPKSRWHLAPAKPPAEP
jgi:small-conductance mechanosensitive channel